MIIKSMSRKTRDFLPLLTYINKDEQRENTAIFHNLRTDPDDVHIIAQEFAENASYSPQRKNGVICYHEILSFPEKITEGFPPDKGARGLEFLPEILEDLAHQYLRLRAPDALAYAKLHTDTQHPHIHFCISGNQIKQKKKNRLSRDQFRQIKEKFREYFREKFPELERLDPQPQRKKSLAFPSTKNRSRSPATGKPGQTIKADLAKKILGIFATAKNPSDALSILSDSGIELYQRGKDAFYGVIFQGKKYRLSTLGIREEVRNRAEVWKRTEKRLRELKAIGQAKEQAREISRF